MLRVGKLWHRTMPVIRGSALATKPTTVPVDGRTVLGSSITPPCHKEHEPKEVKRPGARSDLNTARRSERDAGRLTRSRRTQQTSERWGRHGLCNKGTLGFSTEIVMAHFSVNALFAIIDKLRETLPRRLHGLSSRAKIVIEDLLPLHLAKYPQTHRL